MSRMIAALCLALASSPAVLAQEAKQPDAKPAAPAQPAAPDKPAEVTPKADDGTDPSVRRETKHYNLEKGKPAIGGYDPVAYFPEGGGEAKLGDKANAFTYRGVLYWFASAKNLEAFKKDPRKYEPTYGGWCAYAMGAKGEKVEIDPKSFKITDGRLYLFYKDFFNDTRSKWAADEKNLHPKADANWKKTSGEEPAKKSEGK